MKTKKPNAELVCKQIEDLLVPQLPLPPIDRAVYSYLLRHSRLEGRGCFRFSIRGLARHVHVSDSGARDAVRRLAEVGALRFVERSKAGHVVEVRVPEEIHLPKADEIEASDPKGVPGGVGFLRRPDAARSDPPTRGWTVLLLLAAAYASVEMPGPCGAARGVGA